MSINQVEALEAEKKAFLKAYDAYIAEYVSNAKKVTIKTKTKNDISVIFVFEDESGVRTTREFPEDLIFEYEIAVKALKEREKNDEGMTVEVKEKSTIITVK